MLQYVSPIFLYFNFVNEETQISIFNPTNKLPVSIYALKWTETFVSIVRYTKISNTEQHGMALCDRKSDW